MKPHFLRNVLCVSIALSLLITSVQLPHRQAEAFVQEFAKVVNTLVLIGIYNSVSSKSDQKKCAQTFPNNSKTQFCIPPKNGTLEAFIVPAVTYARVVCPTLAQNCLQSLLNKAKPFLRDLEKKLAKNIMAFKSLCPVLLTLFEMTIPEYCKSNGYVVPNATASGIGTVPPKKGGGGGKTGSMGQLPSFLQQITSWVSAAVQRLLDKCPAWLKKLVPFCKEKEASKPAPASIKVPGNAHDVTKEMVLVPASKITKMPLGIDDTITEVNIPDFMIGKAPVTGALWSEVYNWAGQNGYTFTEYKFTNKGTNLDTGNLGTSKPVTGINWHDAVVWTNAYSQKYGLKPVYRGKMNTVLKNAMHTLELGEVKEVKQYNGYRLPSPNEWEMAARWNGTRKPRKGSLIVDVIVTTEKNDKKYYWTPGKYYASGSTESTQNVKETQRVAWVSGRAETICTKDRNALAICDMSGNVKEWLFTLGLEAPHEWGIKHMFAGAIWRNKDGSVDTYLGNHVSTLARASDTDLGFRVVRDAK